MEQTIVIGPGRKSDREWCAQLMAAGEPWTTLGLGLNATRSALCKPGSALHLARQGNRRVGFILVNPYGLAGAPYIASVAVPETDRGRGIGTQLISYAERRFHDRKHVFLCVSAFNQRARKLYKKLGYRFVGELKDHVVSGHSEFLLCKRLR